MKVMTVRLPADTVERIEAIQGKRRQLAAFVREAVANELERRERDRG